MLDAMPTVLLFLTHDSEHAGGFGGCCITFVFCFIFKHRLVDKEDVLSALDDNFVLLPLSDFTSLFEPADLRSRRQASEDSWCVIH